MRTTILETPDFSDAAVMVEACYTELLRSGFSREADSIRGLEIFSLDSALTALGTLQQINVCDEGANSAVRYAVAILMNLTRPQNELAAAS
jgi:hypothetical protein